MEAAARYALLFIYLIGTMPPHELLDTSGMLEDFFLDAALLGIATALPCYQLCWLLNQTFDTDFEMLLELEIKGAGRTPGYFFPVYQYQLPLNGGEFLLYGIKSGKKRLLPELKNLDNIWLMKGVTATGQLENILSCLRRLPQITLATRLRSEQLPSLQHLLV